METNLALLRQRVQALAEEYRGRGYEVIVEPSAVGATVFSGRLPS